MATKSQDPIQIAAPWELQPKETKDAFEAWQIYRDLPPADRTLARVSKELEKSADLVGRWSSANQWVERSRAYDGYLDRQRIEAHVAAIKDMQKRHTEMAMALQGAGALALNKIIQAEKAVDKDGKPMPLKLKPGEVRDIIELGTKLERLNRGEPESIQETRVVPDPQVTRAPEQLVYDYSKLSVEELRSLKDITNKARNRKEKVSGEAAKSGRARKRN